MDATCGAGTATLPEHLSSPPVFRTLHRKLKIEQHEPHSKQGMNSCPPEGYVVPAPYVAPVKVTNVFPGCLLYIKLTCSDAIWFHNNLFSYYKLTSIKDEKYLFSPILSFHETNHKYSILKYIVLVILFKQYFRLSISILWLNHIKFIGYKNCVCNP
jgi:hypothetical protein